MASFNWIPQASAGCPLCGTSVCDRGFVDCIADTLVRNPEGEVSGVVDLVICAVCLEQIARLIGCMPKSDTMEFAEKYIALEEELEKAKDEIQSWSQRYQQLLDNLQEDISAYLKEKDATSNTVRPKSSKRSS